MRTPVVATCPLGVCTHTLWLHDRDETPGPPLERCTVDDCRCAGISPAWVARAVATLREAS